MKTLAEKGVPLEDRYFPTDRRAAMEQQILQELGQRSCNYETFLLSIRRYLAAVNNLHARVEYNPRPIRLTGLYPFKVHYGMRPSRRRWTSFVRNGIVQSKPAKTGTDPRKGWPAQQERLDRISTILDVNVQFARTGIQSQPAYRRSRARVACRAEPLP